jgi:hypothetical protein
MFKIAVAHHINPVATACAHMLVSKALSQLDGLKPKAAVLFDTFGRDHQGLLNALREKLPGVPLVGASAYGEISTSLGYRLGSSVLVLFGSDRIELTAGVARNLSELTPGEQVERIHQIVKEFNIGEAPVMAIIFPDGVNLDGNAVVRAFSDAMPETLIFGGASAEDLRFDTSSQFFGAEVLQGSVAFLLLSGPVKLSWGITEGFSSGWKPVGERMEAVCEKSEILTVGGKPALDFFNSRFKLDGGYLSVFHPLAVYASPDADSYILRDVPSYDPETARLNLLVEVPERIWVQMTEPSTKTILQASRTPLPTAMSQYYEGEPAGGFVFSCVSRAIVLQQDASSEFSTLIQYAPSSLPLAGFYTYGEIAPSEKTGAPEYHSSTLVVVLVGEEPKPSFGLYRDPGEISAELLRHEIARLNQQLIDAQKTIAQQKQELEHYARADIVAGSLRAESALLYKARLLELLMREIVENGGRLPSSVVIGASSRVNILGLARLLIKRAADGNEPLNISADRVTRLLRDHIA